MRPRAQRSTKQLLGYARVSTAEQRDEGVSLSAQRERIAAFAAAHGHRLVGIEQDVLSGAIVRASRDREHRDRRIVDTRIGGTWTARSPTWTPGSGHRGHRDRSIVDSEIAVVDSEIAVVNAEIGRVAGGVAAGGPAARITRETVT